MQVLEGQRYFQSEFKYMSVIVKHFKKYGLVGLLETLSKKFFIRKSITR